MDNGEPILNRIPFGVRHLEPKGKSFPQNWRQYQKKLYDGKITKDDNVALITGDVPGENYQIVVIDFDGCWLNKKDVNEIKSFLYQIDASLKYYCMIVHTANCGFHFVYMCDKSVEIRNIQRKEINEKYRTENIKGIDIRGNGGLVYFPPTCFLGAKQQYKIIHKGNCYYLVSSLVIKKFINEVFVFKKHKRILEPSPKNDINILFNAQISSLRQPLRDLLTKDGPEIEHLSREAGVSEFLYWLALWIEVKYREIDFNVVINLLSRFQPSFDLKETLHQLKFISDDAKPFTNRKLEEMFPGWKAPKKKILYRGFVD
jgi:hypothetical protein